MTTILTFNDILAILFKDNGKIIPHSIVTPLFDEFNTLINQHYDNVIKYLNNEISRDKIEIIVTRCLEIFNSNNELKIQGLYIALCLIFDNDESVIAPLICRITEEQFSKRKEL